MCFPEIIDLYQRKGIYAIDNDDIKREIAKQENGYVDHIEFQDLLERTREISIASLETYFRFRLSKDEQLIPELSNILNEIIYENGKAKLSEEVVKNLNLSALSNAIRNKFRSSTNRHIQFSIFKGTLTFAQKFNLTLTDNLYKDLLDLMMRMLKNEHLTFDPELLRENLLLKIKPLPTDDLQKIIQNYLSPLGVKDNKLSDEYIEKTLSFLIAFRKSFTTPQLATISNILVQQYLNDKIIFKILQHNEAQKKFIDSKFREHLITQLTKAAVADRLHIYSLLPLVIFEDSYVPTVLNAVAQSFPDIWASFQSDESQGGMLIHLTEQTLLKLLNKDRNDAITSLITLINHFQRQPSNIQFLPIVMQLNRQKGLEQEVQTYFTSVITPAQRSELTLLIEHADINLSFDALTLEHLFTRLVLFDHPSQLIMPALNEKNQLVYIQFLLKNGHYAALANAWLLLPELSNEQETLIVNQIVIQAKSKHNSIRLDELQILLQIIGLSGHNHPLPINDDLIELIMTLISREPASDLFDTGIKFLEKYTQQQGDHIQMLANALMETAYQLNYSTIKKLYERLFALFDVLTDEDKNRLRDLIYIHLLHHLNGDIANLETAIYAIGFAGEFDFHGCEKYFEDFIAIANNYKDSEVSSYYEKLTKIILRKLKKYQSALFKDIKKKLKTEIEPDKE